MSESVMFHDGNRRLQDQFDSRRIADRLEEKLTRTAFTDGDRAFIESAMFFFLATADAAAGRIARSRAACRGSCGSSAPGELAFPDYDGNGMFKSLGNVVVNPERRAAVHRHGREAAAAPGERHGERQPRRSADAALCRRPAPGAGAARAIFPNCPRYIVTPGRRRAVQVRAAAGLPAAGAGVEGLRRLQGLHPSPAADARRRMDMLTVHAPFRSSAGSREREARRW